MIRETPPPETMPAYGFGIAQDVGPIREQQANTSPPASRRHLIDSLVAAAHSARLDAANQRVLVRQAQEVARGLEVAVAHWKAECRLLQQENVRLRALLQLRAG